MFPMPPVEFPQVEYGVLNELMVAVEVPVELSVAEVISPYQSVPVAEAPLYIVYELLFFKLGEVMRKHDEPLKDLPILKDSMLLSPLLRARVEPLAMFPPKTILGCVLDEDG